LPNEAAGSPTFAAGPMPGLVWAFRFHPDGRAEPLDVAQPLYLERHDGWVWLHFDLADARVSQRLRSLHMLPADAVALFASARAAPQLHMERACIFGVLTDFTRSLDGVADEVAHLHFAMTERLLVSGRRQALNAVEAARQALLGGRRLPSVVALLELMITHITAAFDRTASRLAEELDRIEESILTSRPTDERLRLSKVRRTSVRLHRHLAGLGACVRRIESDAANELTPTLQLATGRLLQRIDGLDHDIVATRGRAQFLQEELTLVNAEETNRQLQVLAFVTTTFLPASLIAGIYGMNVKGIPLADGENGFVGVAALLVLASLLTIWLLRRLGIIGR
jgi:zinc transporter